MTQIQSSLFKKMLTLASLGLIALPTWSWASHGANPNERPDLSNAANSPRAHSKRLSVAAQRPLPSPPKPNFPPMYGLVLATQEAQTGEQPPARCRRPSDLQAVAAAAAEFDASVQAGKALHELRKELRRELLKSKEEQILKKEPSLEHQASAAEFKPFGPHLVAPRSQSDYVDLATTGPRRASLPVDPSFWESPTRQHSASEQSSPDTPDEPVGSPSKRLARDLQERLDLDLLNRGHDPAHPPVYQRLLPPPIPGQSAPAAAGTASAVDTAQHKAKRRLPFTKKKKDKKD